MNAQFIKTATSQDASSQVSFCVGMTSFWDHMKSFMNDKIFSMGWLSLQSNITCHAADFCSCKQ